MYHADTKSMKKNNSTKYWRWRLCANWIFNSWRLWTSWKLWTSWSLFYAYLYVYAISTYYH